MKNLSLLKKIAIIATTGIFSVGLLHAADFSKKSDKDFIALAGAVSATDEPDYIIEANKRINAKLYNEAKEFKLAIHKQRAENLKKLSPELAKQRAIDVCKAIQAKTDTMSGKQIRESNLPFIVGDCSHFKGAHFGGAKGAMDRKDFEKRPKCGERNEADKNKTNKENKEKK
ncbi:DUF1104 domain-containing protein [uncultured Helicobacter sp.]|uniref:DUF1104 domain-containing protein n=1 Tax=uncultured Helicobacter sp. TaxID=175537 RepID=UPI0027DCEEA9|nr:DUF1104 domain-containing protein [uncultured Helicobacter sp.]